MALNNQPKLKQIQGGLALRKDVDSLLPLLLSYEASKVLTDIPDGKDGVLSVADVLTTLNSVTGTHTSELSTLSTSIKTLRETSISDYVKLYGTINISKTTSTEYDDTNFSSATYTNEYVTNNMQTVADTSVVDSATLAEYTSLVTNISDFLSDVTDKDAVSTKLATIDAEITAITSDASYDTYPDEFKANVTLLSDAYAEYNTLYSNSLTENVKYSNLTTLDNADDLNTLVPDMQSTSCYVYTEDNKPLLDENGEQIKYNFISDTLTITGIPCVANYEGETIEYKPIEGATRFKVFPVGSFTLESLPKDYLLDNEEMNLVYYSKSIDQLAFSISKNSTVIEDIKKMVGEKAVAKQLEELQTLLQTQITANKTVLDGLTADEATEGSVAYQIKALENKLQDQIDDAVNRISDAEDAIDLLNSDNTTVGSVAYAVKELNDALAPRITTNENEITTLKGDKDTLGSVLNTVHGITDPIDARVTTVEERSTKNQTDISVLNGNSETTGSVDYKIAQATVEKYKELDAKDTALDARIDGVIGNDTTTTETITSLDSRLDALEGSTSQWNGNTLYTNDTPIVQAHGGIAVGETFKDVPISTLLTKILYPYIKPTISLSGAPIPGVYEVGDGWDAISLTAKVEKKSRDITKVDFYKDNVLISTDNTGWTSSTDVTYNYQVIGEDGVSIVRIESDTTFKAIVTDAENGTVTSNTLTYKFVNPAYYGKTTYTADELTGDFIKTLTKKVAEPTNIETTYATLNEERMIFACPSGWTLKNILDPNSFDIINSFDVVTVPVTCLDGIDRNYTVYISNKATTQSNFTVKYNVK